MVKQKYLVQNSPMVTTFTNDFTHLSIAVSITSIKETPLVGVNPTVKLAHTPQSHTRGYRYLDPISHKVFIFWHVKLQ